MNPFIIYIPELNEFHLHANEYGLPIEAKMLVLRLTSNFEIEYIGEL